VEVGGRGVGVAVGGSAVAAGEVAVAVGGEAVADAVEAVGLAADCVPAGEVAEPVATALTAADGLAEGLALAVARAVEDPAGDCGAVAFGVCPPLAGVSSSPPRPSAKMPAAARVATAASAPATMSIRRLPRPPTCSAVPAAVAAVEGAAATDAPHDSQNAAPGGSAAPHCAQAAGSAANAVPHCSQNFASPCAAAPHDGHVLVSPATQPSAAQRRSQLPVSPYDDCQPTSYRGPFRVRPGW
jgi:hypothetical protein